MPGSPDELGREALALCRERGFALAGIADCSPSARVEELRAWLAAGRHGTMDWLAETAADRIDPGRLLRGARSVVMVADQYATRGRTTDSTPAAMHGRIARYARGRDYHRVMKRRLHAVCDALREHYPGEGFRAFVDTAPVPERELAARAGLGWIGKHTLLIHPQRGSWLVLGGFLTTLELRDPDGAAVTDHCGTCTRCIDACPTGAISPYSVDGSRCISYLTIERREPIQAEFHGSLGGWLVGCDVCQEVCPHNSPRQDDAATGAAHPDYAPRRDSFDLLDVLGWDDATRRARFANSAMKRITLTHLKRTAALLLADRLAADGSASEIAAAVDRLSDSAWSADVDPTVREAAREAIASLTRAGVSEPGACAATPATDPG